MNERRGRRGGGRAARQAARRDAPVSTSPYLVRTMPPVEMLDEEGMVQIEENAETILSCRTRVKMGWQVIPKIRCNSL